MLSTILTIEKATIPTTTPATPQMKDALAVVSFCGSPCDVKKRIPDITKRIIAITTKTTQTTSKILLINWFSVGPEVFIGKGANAKAATGSIKKADKIKTNFFLFILLITAISVPARPPSGGRGGTEK